VSSPVWHSLKAAGLLADGSGVTVRFEGRSPVLHRSVVAWTVGVCSVRRCSQAKASAGTTRAAMRGRRASQADIGRAMETGTVTKYNIKRTSRFISNNRVDIAEGRRGLVGLAAKAGRGRLVIAVGWVDLRRYKALRAAVPLSKLPPGYPSDTPPRHKDDGVRGRPTDLRRGWAQHNLWCRRAWCSRRIPA